MYVSKQSPLKQYIPLGDTEAAVVNILLKVNGASISCLSEKIGLARTSIYNAVRKLTNKGMVAKKDFLYFLSDRNIEKHTTQKQTPLSDIDNLMKEISNLRGGEIVYSVESDEEIRELFTHKNDLLQWQKKVARNRIVLKGIGSMVGLQYFQSMIDREMVKEIKQRSGSGRFSETPISGYCTIISFRQSVIFLSRKKQYYYRVDNEHVAAVVQKIIDLLYGYLEFKTLM